MHWVSLQVLTYWSCLHQSAHCVFGGGMGEGCGQWICLLCAGRSVAVLARVLCFACVLCCAVLLAYVGASVVEEEQEQRGEAHRGNFY